MQSKAKALKPTKVSLKEALVTLFKSTYKVMYSMGKTVLNAQPIPLQSVRKQTKTKQNTNNQKSS